MCLSLFLAQCDCFKCRSLLSSLLPCYQFIPSSSVPLTSALMSPTSSDHDGICGGHVAQSRTFQSQCRHSVYLLSAAVETVLEYHPALIVASSEWQFTENGRAVAQHDWTWRFPNLFTGAPCGYVTGERSDSVTRPFGSGSALVTASPSKGRKPHTSSGRAWQATRAGVPDIPELGCVPGRSHPPQESVRGCPGARF